MEIFVATVWGLIVGSFLNVVIHRLSKVVMGNPEASMEYLLWPSSTAPCCNSKLSWYENIPVLSWIFLRGRCGHCGYPITPRYIIVELLTAAAFAWSAWQFELGYVGILYALFFSLAICLFFIDLETYLLPDHLTLAMLWLGLLGSSFGLLPVTPTDAIWGACLGYVLLWSINRLYFLVRKHDGFGGGDFKLLAALGVWTGWVNIVPILCGASIIGLLMVGFAAAAKRENLSLNKAFLFGPFLILSGLGFIVSKL